MNAIKAGKIAEDLRTMDDQYQKVAGWSCGGLTSLGLDLDDHYSKHQGLRNKLPAKMLRENKTKIVNEYIQTVIK
jgi:hypothetical protein